MSNIDDQNLTDEALLEKLATTQETVYLEILYDRFADQVFYRCLSMLHNRKEAEDICHDIFLRLFIKAKNFKGKSKFSSWLFSITYNLCIDRLRRNKRYQMVEIPTDWNPPASDDSESELLAIKSKHLEKMLAALKTEERLLLLMKYQDELPVKAIAGILKLGESAVKMRLKRARAHALQIYQKELNRDFG